MEWVENTKPLGDVLIGRGNGWAASAHARYRPEDWTLTAARSHMTTVCRLAPKTSKDKALKPATDSDRFKHYCEVCIVSAPLVVQWFRRVAGQQQICRWRLIFTL